jgi:hypothetical protein
MTPLDLHEIKRLREQLWGWERIAKHLGCSERQIRKLVDPAYVERLKSYNRRGREGKGKRENYYGVSPSNYFKREGVTVPPSVEAARVERLNAPYRSPFAEMLGEPPRGYSALDRKMAGASA